MLVLAWGSEFTPLALMYRDQPDGWYVLEIPALGRRREEDPEACCPDSLAELQVQCRDHASKNRGENN